MADVTITIPDEYVLTVLAAFADHYDYDNQKLEGETQAQFAKRMIISKMKQIVRRYKIKTAIDNPMQQAIDETDLINLS